MPRTTNATRRALTTVAKRLGRQHAAFLRGLKNERREIETPDFPWTALLRSLSTWGGAAGWDRLSANKEDLARLRYQRLRTLQPAMRSRVIRGVVRRAKLRFPNLKANCLNGCFDRVSDRGGLRRIKAELLALRSKAGKIAYLKEFPGIGEKYARNLLMDVYDPHMRDSIAIDARVQSISKARGLKFSDYDAQEAFYVSIAHAAGLNGWELDRLLFYFRDEFLPQPEGKLAGRIRGAPRASS